MSIKEDHRLTMADRVINGGPYIEGNILCIEFPGHYSGSCSLELSRADVRALVEVLEEPIVVGNSPVAQFRRSMVQSEDGTISGTFTKWGITVRFSPVDRREIANLLDTILLAWD